MVATATRRMLQELALRGYRSRDLAESLSTSTAHIHYIRSGVTERVREKFEERTCDLYDSLATGFGDSLETMEFARSKGYLPASRYEHITDDKTWLNKPTLDEIVIDVAFFVAQGEETWFIGERLGLGSNEVDGIVKRYELA